MKHICKFQPHVFQMLKNKSEMDFLKLPFGSELQQKSISLREKVLRIPLGLNFNEDELSAESGQHHLAAIKDGEVLGILLLVPKGDEVKMRQVAITPNQQGLGIGRELVRFAEGHAKTEGWKMMILNARLTARSFYLNLGYLTDDIVFEEVGIPHIRMWKDLK